MDDVTLARAECVARGHGTLTALERKQQGPFERLGNTFDAFAAFMRRRDKSSSSLLETVRGIGPFWHLSRMHADHRSAGGTTPSPGEKR